MGNLVFQATLGGQVNLVGPNTASTFNLNVPAVSSTIASLAAQTFAGTQTFTVDAVINGLTVGKGGGAVSTNTAVGASALNANTTGGGNAALSRLALVANTTGNDNTSAGNSSMQSNTTGSSNTAFGSQALTSNTTASNNTAVGYQAGYSNTTGTELTAIGYKSAYSQTTAVNSYNVAVGNYALYQNQTGTQNTVVGWNALANATTSSNTAIGYQALTSANSGSQNVACGSGAFPAITNGAGNTAIGESAGKVIATGNNNTFVGQNGSASGSAVSHEILIGCNTTGKGSNTGFINPNGGGVYQGNNSATWSITSDQRLKKNIVDNTEGLEIISQIRVRNFEYRTAEEVTELPSHTVIEKNGVQLGVIAQELQEVCGDCVKTESTGVMSVNQDNLTWHMINAIKDLKALVDAQATEITALKAKVGI